MPGLINKRQLLRDTLAVSGGLRVLESVSTWSGLIVLNYHRIGSSGNSPLDHALWSATADDFEQQVRRLQRSSEVIGLDDLPRAIDDLRRVNQRGKRVPNSNRFSMITFDDGYRDNFELAYPILQSQRVPGVFFITTGFLDTRRLAWWDEIAWMVRSSDRPRLQFDEHWQLPLLESGREQQPASIRTLLRRFYQLDGSQTAAFLDDVAAATGSGRAPTSVASGLWMNWDNVRAMRRSGMSFGAHTVNHPVLSRLPFAEQNAELAESRLRLEQELGEFVTALSYPVGSRDAFNAETRAALHQNDFDWAFSYYGGYSNSAAFTTDKAFDQFDIPRIAIESDTTLREFRSICSLPQIFARH